MIILVVRVKLKKGSSAHVEISFKGNKKSN